MTTLRPVADEVKVLTCEVCDGRFFHETGVRGPNPRKCQKPGCRATKLPDRVSAEGRRRARMSEPELRRHIGRERLDPLWQDNAATVVLEETVEAGLRAGRLVGADRTEVHGAVLALARAEGADGTYEELMGLAAAAIAWAARLRPGQGTARPDFDGIPDRLAEGEQQLLAEAA